MQNSVVRDIAAGKPRPRSFAVLALPSLRGARRRAFVALAVALALVAAKPPAARADAVASALDALRQQMQQMQQQMLQMQKKIDSLEAEKKNGARAASAKGGAPVEAGAKGSPSARGSAEVAATTASASTTAPPSASTTAQAPASNQPWLHGQPITIASAGANYMNISFDAITALGTSTQNDVSKLQLGDHDPDQRGFSLRNAEMALDGAVDPYFKGFANVVFKLDKGNETSVELEEAYLLSTSLPWNLQVKGGQFFAEFGRQNPTHPHTWAFVDEPLIMGRLLGGDGLRNVGARISWLAPTPFYTEVLLGVFNGEGGTAYSFRDSGNTFGRTPVDHGIHSVGDLLFVPRVTSSFDLTDNQTLIVGASGAFGPNDTGPNGYTKVYGADMYWKWRPENAQQGFPYVAWQTEGMFRQYHADADVSSLLPKENFDDYGFYSQLMYGFRVRWVAALRGEYVTGNSSDFDAIDPSMRGNRMRVSPNITFYPTEFSKLRLQYNYDHGQVFGDDHSVWMQVEFILGAHGAHKF